MIVLKLAGRAAARNAARSLAIGCILGWIVADRASAGDTFGSETFTLANGMQVVVIPNHRAPVVHNSIWYRIGAADEPPGKGGLAHMLEHMMFKGTAEVAGGGFSKVVAQNGGNDNAFTNKDYTGYYQNIAADRLELVMKMEADRMVNLSFTAADFETERDVVLEERRTRIDNRPRSQFAEQFQARMFISHPYGRPTIGWDHEIRDFTREDALELYRTYYAPNNAIMIVSGDVTAAAVKPMAERIFGPIPASDIEPRTRPQEPRQRVAVRLRMQDPQVANVEWRRGYLAPCYHCGDVMLTLAIDVLSYILGGNPTSRLYQALVVEQKIADFAGAYFDGVAYDQTPFMLVATLREDTEVATLEAAVDAELAGLLADGISQKEFERAKFGLRARATYARDNLQTMARIFGAALTSGMTVDDVERWPSDLAALTMDQVMDAARLVFGQETSVTGVLRPQPAASAEAGRD